MAEEKPKYKLADNIEHYLALLSKLYARNSEKVKQEILVNSEVRVHEAWNVVETFDGDRYGHALYLTVPISLYLENASGREKLQQQLEKDINSVHNFTDEFIQAVFLEAQKQTDGDWRAESGLLVGNKRVIAPATEKRIWPTGGFKLFLSHKSKIKGKATELKEALGAWGISCFVAHNDIRPTKEWQNEIENALSSMDALVALMSESFHDSEWTDQEIGYAFGRGVPIIAVRLGTDPYGFIGRFQALSCEWEKLPLELVKLFIGNDAMLNAYIGVVEKCRSFNHGNSLAEVLPLIEKLSKSQAERLAAAYKSNGELRGSFGFNGEKPTFYGEGLFHHLRRITGQEYDDDVDEKGDPEW